MLEDSARDEAYGSTIMASRMVEKDGDESVVSRLPYFRGLLGMLTSTERLVFRDLRHGCSKQAVAVAREVTVRRIEQVMKSIDAKAKLAKNLS
jgi:DNA-binding NarL/FixJ family response regulator